MNYLQIFLGLVALVINVYSSAIISRRRPHSWTSRLVTIFCVVTCTYIVVNYLSLYPPNLDDQLFWIRAVMAITALNGPILIVLAHTFPGDRLRLSWKYLLSIGLIAVATSAMSFTSLVFQSLYFDKGIAATVSGGGVPFWAIEALGSIAVASVITVIRYAQAPLAEKILHLQFLLSMISSSILMITTTFIGNAFLHSSATVFLGPLMFTILFVSLAFILPGRSTLREKNGHPEIPQ